MTRTEAKDITIEILNRHRKQCLSRMIILAITGAAFLIIAFSVCSPLYNSGIAESEKEAIELILYFLIFTGIFSLFLYAPVKACEFVRTSKALKIIKSNGPKEKAIDYFGIVRETGNHEQQLRALDAIENRAACDTSENNDDSDLETYSS